METRFELSNKAWKEIVKQSAEAESRKQNLDRRGLAKVSGLHSFNTEDEAKDFIAQFKRLARGDKEQPEGFRILTEKNGTYTVIYNYYLPKIKKNDWGKKK